MIMVRRILLLIVAIAGNLVRNCQTSNEATSCSAPNITRLNFQLSIEILSGYNGTLSCGIISDTQLKAEPIWRKDNSPLSVRHSVTNTTCSSANGTCIISNLTLINVTRKEYVGNYTLTAENECGDASVYVEVEIIVLPTCQNDYAKPPPLKIPPPQYVQTLQGSSVNVSAVYGGNMNATADDVQVVAYWCIIRQDTPNYHCITPTNNKTDSNYKVTISGCPLSNLNCCYFTVTMEIKSLTVDLSGVRLMSAAAWDVSVQQFVPGNSKLIVYIRPTLDKWLPNLNDKCKELEEGEPTEFTCVYNASTNSNVTITSWMFNKELLYHDSNRYTMITIYGGDPVNPHHVFSRLTLSNVKVDDTGTYTCQCSYNSHIFDNKTITSGAASFCVKVKPGHQSYIKWTVIGGGALIIIILLVAVILIIIYIKLKFNKLKTVSMQCSDEYSPLLPQPKQITSSTPLLKVTDDHRSMTQSKKSTVSTSHSINETTEVNTGDNNSQDRSLTRTPSDDHESTDHTEIQDHSILISSSNHPSLNGKSKATDFDHSSVSKLDGSQAPKPITVLPVSPHTSM